MSNDPVVSAAVEILYPLWSDIYSTSTYYVARLGYWNTHVYNTLQRRTAVTAYLTSEQLLQFIFARNCSNCLLLK